jgi:hypothetical protein
MDGFVPKDNTVDLSKVERRHWDESWTAEESKKALEEHSMLTWGPSGAIKDLPLMVSFNLPHPT